jgi:hypothetical protein
MPDKYRRYLAITSIREPVSKEILSSEGFINFERLQNREDEHLVRQGGRKYPDGFLVDLTTMLENFFFLRH